MHELLPAPDDVIAVRMSGKISSADLDATMDRLDAVMARHETCHVYVETRGIGGLEIASLPSYWARAMPLFGKLHRFGRVAVVADQSWIRIGTRVESALLPNISYRVYLPDERDRALAWVTGEASSD